jgi:hypothetical protein
VAPPSGGWGAGGRSHAEHAFAHDLEDEPDHADLVPPQARCNFGGAGGFGSDDPDRDGFIADQKVEGFSAAAHPNSIATDVLQHARDHIQRACIFSADAIANGLAGARAAIRNLAAPRGCGLAWEDQAMP